MDRRERIVRAAADLFARQGFKATTIADISEAVGLSPSAGGLYRHFASKDALLEAVVDLAQEQIDDAHLDSAAIATAHDPLDVDSVARLAGHFLLERIRINRNLLTIMRRDLTEHPHLQKRIDSEMTAPVMDEVVSWISQLDVADRRDGVDIEALAYVMMTTLDALAMSDDERINDERAIAMWAAALVGAIRTPITEADVPRSGPAEA